MNLASLLMSNSTRGMSGPHALPRASGRLPKTAAVKLIPSFDVAKENSWVPLSNVNKRGFMVTF